MKLKSLDLSVESALDAVEISEGAVKKAPLDCKVIVQILPKKQIQVTIAGHEFVGVATPALIHQFGSRVWKNLTLAQTMKLWCECDESVLSQRLSEALSGSGDMLRYTNPGAERRIYGLTSSQFLEMKQSQFRSQLTEALGMYDIKPSQRVAKTSYGEVVEDFSVPSQGRQVELNCRVIYGLNNGYSSYRVSWGRTVLICSNGLTQYQSVAKTRWLHNDEVSVSDFVSSSVEDAYDHLLTVEKQIDAAQCRSVNYSQIDQFLTRLAIAAATKERVAKRIEHELTDTGCNEWSISQALTYLGEHENAIPISVRGDLTRVGSSLLERSLNQVLASPVKITSQGYYDIIH